MGQNPARIFWPTVLNDLRNRGFGVEAPPGIEPGMEVLQTSALPLGDGAVWRAARAKARAYVRKLPKLKLGPTYPGY